MSENLSSTGISVVPMFARAKSHGRLFRVRGDAMIAGEVGKVDLASADAGTTESIGSNAIGTSGSGSVADSGDLATMLPVGGATAAGVVGVALEAVADNATGMFAMGDRGDGDIVEGLVLVDAGSTRGAELVVTAAGGYGIFTPGGVGAIYGILLEAATADDGSGPSASYNLKKVLFRKAPFGFRQT
jgi:hypothetical protein